MGHAACRPSGRREMQAGFLVGKPERKSPLAIPRHRWKDNITMNLEAMEWERYELD